MTEELEQALRRALRPRQPGRDLADRVVPHLASADSKPGRQGALLRLRLRASRSRWLPAALAASVVLGIGLAQLRQHALETARADRARAQLLTALGIAAENVNAVRATVAREEHPDS